MPLPLILGAIAIAAGGYGIKKGLDAKEDFDKAESIGRSAKRRHENAIESLEAERNTTNERFKALGTLKVDIFSNQIKYLVDEIKKKKNAKSSLKEFEQTIAELNVPDMEKMVTSSLAIEKGLASGAVSGALMGLGAYGSVGMLASASTGTAIASLSGAAATNATLAWLGGGALSAGGLGIAGGTAVLGGLVAGPAIAITGFVMASQAEEALSKAWRYESEVDEAIAKIKSMEIVLKGLQANAREMDLVLKKLAAAFDRCKPGVASNDEGAFQRMLAVGRTLKTVLDTPILEKDGSAVQNLEKKLKIVTSGVLEYHG